LGMLKVEEDKVYPIIEKKALKLTKDEEFLKTIAEETARLLWKYGKPAAVALSARKVKASNVESVLEKESKMTDNFYEMVLEIERKVLSKRFG